MLQIIILIIHLSKPNPFVALEHEKPNPFVGFWWPTARAESVTPNKKSGE